MLGAIKQITVSYEQHGMTPDEIAEDQGLEVTAVKAALSQYSSMYRKDVDHEKEGEDGLDFTSEQLRQMNAVIFDSAVGATLPDGSIDHRTRLKAAQYIRDDFKGRLEPVRAIHKNVTNNLFQINEAIANARVGAEKAKRQITERAAYGQSPRPSVNETNEQRALGQDLRRNTGETDPVTTVVEVEETELVAAQ